MMGWQAEGAAPIVRGHAIKKPETIASGNPDRNPCKLAISQ